jgi:hypothetical protein
MTPDEQVAADPPPRARKIVTALRGLGAVVAAFTQFFPGAAYFYDFAPPFFPPLGIFVSIVGVVVMLLSYNYWRHKKNVGGWSIALIVAAVILLAVYGVCLQYLTVIPPQGRSGGRRQIGFYMAEFSLTPKAFDLVMHPEKLNPPREISTPNDLMGAFGVWGGVGRTDEIWTLQSILLAGTALFCLFLAGFVVWACGIGALARYAVSE